MGPSHAPQLQRKDQAGWELSKKVGPDKDLVGDSKSLEALSRVHGVNPGKAPTHPSAHTSLANSQGNSQLSLTKDSELCRKHQSPWSLHPALALLVALSKLGKP